MRLLKIALLTLPLFVLADNPVDPADRDAPKSEPSKMVDVKKGSEQLITSGFETTSEYTSDENGLEELVVTGIRGSLQSAIDIKRSNVGIVDAISAEDFGKFPDNNLAESLARVVGIGIDRSNVEGERVAVRGFGPELNLVTLNGRQMPTVPGQYQGGRSFNFGDISSHGISSVEIYKSTNSTLPSGGIGSTINMVTTKPLATSGSRTSFSVDTVKDTTSKETWIPTPMEAAFVHSSNLGKWGFAISGSYQERNNRETGTRESNWITVEDMALVEGYSRVDKTAAGIINNNTRTDGKTFYQEPSAYQFKDNDRLRVNGQVTLQYELSEALMATIDYTYSKVDFSSNGQMFGSWLGGWTTKSGTINSNGVYTDVVVGERGFDHTLVWGETENLNESVGFNLDWNYSDALSFELDFHDSSAEKSGTELPNEMSFATPATATVTHQNGGASGINKFVYDKTFTASDFSYTGSRFRDADKENTMKQFQLKGEWLNLEGGFLKSIAFGASSVESEFTDVRMENVAGLSPSTAASAALFEKTSMNSFFDSFSTSKDAYYFNIDPELAKSSYQALFGAFNAGAIDTNDRVEETIDSLFVQADMEFLVAGRALNVVAGVRYEDSSVLATGLESTPSNIRWDMITGLQYISGGVVDAPKNGSNDLLLPQVAMAYAIDEDRVLRFSAGQSMARPSLQDMRSSLNFGNRDYFTPTATGGNPNLEPMKSTNYDLAYEWYYDEGSYFALNYFYKEIEDFIESKITNGGLYGLNNPAQSANGLYAQQCVNAWASAGSPAPGFPGEAGSTGDCVSQQALWAQSWMNLQQHMGWVALGMANGADVSNGFPYGLCQYDGWWRCDPGYIDATSSDPAANFEITRPVNAATGSLDGFEIVLQHLFGDTGYGMQLNATVVSGGDVDIDRNKIGKQFILPGLGDSSNASFFYEDDKLTARIALNVRGETVAGFAAYDQPLYVAERQQVDASVAYRFNDQASVFLEVQNLNDESTRLYVRHEEMLFLAQDHGPVYRFGFRYSL